MARAERSRRLRVIELVFGRTIARTPRAMNGAPTTAKIPARSTKTAARRKHQRQHRPQRQRDVHRRHTRTKSDTRISTSSTAPPT